MTLADTQEDPDLAKALELSLQEANERAQVRTRWLEELAMNRCQYPNLQTISLYNLMVEEVVFDQLWKKRIIFIGQGNDII